MMNKIKALVLTFAVMMGVVALTPSTIVSADAKTEIRNGFNQVGGATETTTIEVRIKNIVNIFLYIIGVLSVIMIIIGGLRYTTSAGDSSRIKAAKDTIMYAVVGLAIAIVAYAIVNFVLTNL
jgi:hypothetical protein